jgi:uncharacterized paraquat-inducible protein A
MRCYNAAMASPDIIRAHRHSSNHRQEVLASERCGCFHCCAVFPPSEIVEWVDDEQTALCPRCGIDAVICSDSDSPITLDFLAAMKSHWFRPA